MGICQPPLLYDYVCCELGFVSPEYEGDFVRLLLERYVTDGERLIITQYFSRGESPSPIHEILQITGSQSQNPRAATTRTARNERTLRRYIIDKG